MSTFKQFTTQDVIVSPLELNKGFTFIESEFISSSIGIDRFIGTNLTSSNISTNADPQTGFISQYSQRTVYDLVKQLYFTNYIQNPVPTSSYFTGSTDVYSRFYNYLASPSLDVREFPTGSNDKVGVISIPSQLYGNYIVPGTFTYQSSSLYIYDDKNGNLYESISNNQVGNIIYPHGLAIITDSTLIPNFNNFVTGSEVTCSFSSSFIIYETQYACTLRENEFNFTLNPSAISGSNGQVYDFITGSEFSPFVTTVGLYNENQDLLAVAKLSQPLLTNLTTDTTINVCIDLI